MFFVVALLLLLFFCVGFLIGRHVVRCDVRVCFPFSVCDVFVLRFPCVVFVVFDALFVTFLFFLF